MILPDRMTYGEILQQCVADGCFSMKRIARHEEQILREARRADRYPYSKLLGTATNEATRNTVITIARVGSKARMRKGLISDCCISVAQSRTGLQAYIICICQAHGTPVLSQYNPHIYRRYAERFGCELSGTDLISRFHVRNSFMTHSIEGEGDEAKDGAHMFGVIRDGVLLGRFAATEDAAVMRWNTFVTYDMLKRTQSNLAEVLQRSYESYQASCLLSPTNIAMREFYRRKGDDNSKEFADVERRMWRMFDKLQKLKSN